MWRDALLLDQPVQHRSGPVSGIGCEPLRLETEALSVRSILRPGGRRLAAGESVEGLSANAAVMRARLRRRDCVPATPANSGRQADWGRDEIAFTRQR
jgi:hypothetical protein